MKFGLIGTGAMTRRFLAAVEGKGADVTFVAAYSPDPMRRDNFSQSYPHIQCYEDYSTLLADSGVQAIYIATPVDTHEMLTKKAVERGVHVLCEKPMALTLPACTHMVEAARKNEVVLQIGYMMRFHPAHQYIREQIAAGALGDIQFVHIERTTFADFKAPDFPAHRKWFVDRSKSGGGVFVDLGSHLLDLLLYLLDDEVEDCALSATPDFDLGVELSGLASLKFMKGTMATLFASWGINLHDNLLQIYGDRGCIQAMRTIGPYTDWSVELVQGDQRTAVKIPYQNHYIRELDHFVDCIQTGKEPLTSGANCLETERLRIQLMNSLHQ